MRCESNFSLAIDRAIEQVSTYQDAKLHVMFALPCPSKLAQSCVPAGASRFPAFTRKNAPMGSIALECTRWHYNGTLDSSLCIQLENVGRLEHVEAVLRSGAQEARYLAMPVQLLHVLLSSVQEQ